MGEFTEKNEPMSPQEAVAHIKAQTGDPSRFKVRSRGYIDWKFGELAEYMGYEQALRYADACIKWPDGRARGSRLEATYFAFLEVEGFISNYQLDRHVFNDSNY